MALASILHTLQADIQQCDLLIAHAHGVDTQGAHFMSHIDRQQVTVASFLNMFIAWEFFLESSFIAYMTGDHSISGTFPIRYVFPPTPDLARSMIVGTQRYFDYGNHENVKKTALTFFENGVPFEPHISGLISDLADIRTMRNASAHITSSTQTALEGLAQRIFGAPQPNIDLYTLLTSIHPAVQGSQTVFATYRDKLVVGATLIAN